jgi:hypothetical protein
MVRPSIWKIAESEEQSMTMLGHLRQNNFFSRKQLGRLVRLPPQSIERMERNEYPLDRIGTDGQATLEQDLQEALRTSLGLPELLMEI